MRWENLWLPATVDWYYRTNRFELGSTSDPASWLEEPSRCVVIGRLLMDLMMLIDSYRSMIVRFASPATRGFLSLLLFLSCLIPSRRKKTSGTRVVGWQLRPPPPSASVSPSPPLLLSSLVPPSHHYHHHRYHHLLPTLPPSPIPALTFLPSYSPFFSPMYSSYVPTITPTLLYSPLLSSPLSTPPFSPSFSSLLLFFLPPFLLCFLLSSLHPFPSLLPSLLSSSFLPSHYHPYPPPFTSSFSPPLCMGWKKVRCKGHVVLKRSQIFCQPLVY